MEETKEEPREDPEHPEDKKEKVITMPATNQPTKKKKITAISNNITYKFNGLSMTYNEQKPTRNSVFKVGTVHHRESRPPSGSDAERKLTEALSKNQYDKYTRNYWQ